MQLKLVSIVAPPFDHGYQQAKMIPLQIAGDDPKAPFMEGVHSVLPPILIASAALHRQILR